MEGPGKRTTAVVATAAELKQFSSENLSTRAYISVTDAGKVNSLHWLTEGERVQGRTKASLVVGYGHWAMRTFTTNEGEYRQRGTWNNILFLLWLNSF